MAGEIEAEKAWLQATKDYVDELKLEMRRVTWPNRKQVEAHYGCGDCLRFRVRGVLQDCRLDSRTRQHYRVFQIVTSKRMPDENVHDQSRKIGREAVPRRPKRTSDAPRMPARAKRCRTAAAGGSASRRAAALPPKNWYIIHTYSGFENKVAESLRTRVRGLWVCAIRSGRF